MALSDSTRMGSMPSQFRQCLSGGSAVRPARNQLLQGSARPGPVAGKDIGARQVNIGRLVIWRDLDSITKGRDGVLGLLHAHVQYAKVINCAGMIGLKL